MKTILCYGDSNAWGNIAGSFNPETMLHQRYDYPERWTGLLQKILGEHYHVIESNLNGRSTSFDEIGIVRPSRNGLTTLPGILEMHYPLDMVVLMLGTNDLKAQYQAEVSCISDGMRQLIHCVKASAFGKNGQMPLILVIAPAPIQWINSPLCKVFFDAHSVEKSRQLSSHYQQLAEEENCLFLDSADWVKVSPVDGIHIDKDSHPILAKVVADKIRAIL
jgi:lysophospholipase L1-like esterase